jgi:hypothetical protein
MPRSTAESLVFALPGGVSSTGPGDAARGNCRLARISIMADHMNVMASSHISARAGRICSRPPANAGPMMLMTPIEPRSQLSIEMSRALLVEISGIRACRAGVNKTLASASDAARLSMISNGGRERISRKPRPATMAARTRSVPISMWTLLCRSTSMPDTTPKTAVGNAMISPSEASAATPRWETLSVSATR